MLLFTGILVWFLPKLIIISIFLYSALLLIVFTNLGQLFISVKRNEYLSLILTILSASSGFSDVSTVFSESTSGTNKPSSDLIQGCFSVSQTVSIWLSELIPILLSSL